MVIETFEEPGEWDCPFCPEPVARLDEVVVLATHQVAHLDCYQAHATGRAA